MDTTPRDAVAVLFAALVALSIAAAPGGPSGVAAASHQPPTADAGPDREVAVGSNVTLDGSGSIDPRRSLSYVWVLVENPGNDDLRGDTTISPTFTPSTTGTYVASLTVRDAQGRRDSDFVTINVTGTAAGSPTLDATLGTDAVAPGERTNLSVTLVNNGSVGQGSINEPSFTERIGTARGLNVSVGRGDGPLRVLTGNFGIGSLAEGNATTLSVPVAVAADARPGTYRVPVDVSYAYTPWIDPDGNETSDRVERTLHLDLTVEAAPRFRVESISTDLRVNDTDAVALTLANDGRAAATESTVSLSSANPSIGVGGATEATRFVGDWPAGVNRTVEFEVSAADAAAPQPYPLAVSVEWEDDGEVRSETRHVALEPRPEGSFAVEARASSLAVDATGRLAGTLTNTGTEPVHNAVVVLADRPETFVPRESEQFLGTVEPGGRVAFAFPVEVSERASAGPHRVGVVARYRDADGDSRRSSVMDLRTAVDPERPAFHVTAADATLPAGSAAGIALSVTNAGHEPYRDVTVRAFPGGRLAAPDDRASIPVLEPGESTDVELTVSAVGSAAPRTYPVSVDVRYDVGGETRIAGTYRVPVRVVEPEDDGGGLPLVTLFAAGTAAGLGLVWYYRRRPR